MTVSAILAEKGTSVVTLVPSTPLLEICHTLMRHRIGSVLIMDGSDILGIVSERDIVRIMAASGNDGLSRPASDYMTRKLVTCTPDDTIH